MVSGRLVKLNILPIAVCVLYSSSPEASCIPVGEIEVMVAGDVIRCQRRCYWRFSLRWLMAQTLVS